MILLLVNVFVWLSYREESRFWEEMEKHIDLNNSTHLWLNTANRFTGIRLVGF